jgi:NAD(P)-dependent dehydrogenase (short-subunit alcohol dehydrogenase family)
MPAPESKVAIVTGGSAGLGREMTLALLAAGHRVTVVGRTQALMDEVSGAARAAGTADRLFTVIADVTAPAACTDAVARTVAHFGAVDALVNNAGVNLPTHIRRGDPKFWKVAPDVWRNLMDTNVNGTFYMAHAVAPHLIERGWGRIVNHITSLRTMIRPGDTPYGPSKAALEALTTAWAGEFAGTGVTVNAIMPGGAADTRMIATELVPDRARLVNPAVMGPPIVWLLSTAADAFSGYRITAERWDPQASIETNLAKSAAETGWKELLNAGNATARSWPPK